MNPKNVDRRIDPILDCPIAFALTAEAEALPPPAHGGQLASDMDQPCSCGLLRGEHMASGPTAYEKGPGQGAWCMGFEGPSGVRLVVDNTKPAGGK